MDCSSQTEPIPALRCRLRLTLDAGDDTETEVDIDVEELLRGPFDDRALLFLPTRVIEVLALQLVPTVRKALRRWVNDRVATNPDSFEDEFVRRCDSNDKVISALEWIAPHVESDEEREWKSRMVEVVMAQCANEQVR